MEEIYKRRSIRKYIPKEISKETLEKILKAGMNAPSARNLKAYEFIIVKDKENLKEMSLLTPFSGMIKDSDATIIMISKDESPYWQFDLGLVFQNMMLEATKYDVGTCCIGIQKEKEDFLKEKLNIPKDFRILCLLSCGYPAEEREKNNNYYAEKVHYESY